MSRKLQLIRAVLDHYFRSPPIPLNSVNEFTFLVAVVLSAQTTDGVVNQVTKELFKVASSPQSLASLPVDDVRRIIQSVGLANNKAKFIVSLSQKLIDDFNGRVPSTLAELKSLPGVGHKTASVVMSQVFGVPSIAVDTHVHRLALRWGLTKETKNPDKVQVDLCSVFPEGCWNKIHLQMIYFGREFCTAKNHNNSECPICSWVHKPESALDEREILQESVLKGFQSKPRSKGIVYYADRLTEMQQLESFQCTETTCVSPFTQSMTNLMSGYKVDPHLYRSPVRCVAISR